MGIFDFLKGKPQKTSSNEITFTQSSGFRGFNRSINHAKR